jgi:cold shock CspA family protein
MRGKVLSFNDTSGRGLISGEDGQRYTFMRAGLEDGLRTIRPGVDVDFQVNDGEATGIYVIPGGYTIGDKNKIVAALLAFFIGGLGVHKFYLGKNQAGS